MWVRMGGGVCWKKLFELVSDEFGSNLDLAFGSLWFLGWCFLKKKRRMLNDEYGEYARKVRPQRTKKKRKEKKNGRLLAFGCFLHGYQSKRKQNSTSHLIIEPSVFRLGARWG